MASFIRGLTLCLCTSPIKSLLPEFKFSPSAHSARFALFCWCLCAPWLLCDEVVPFSEQETCLRLCGFWEPVKCWLNDYLVVCEKCLLFWIFTYSAKLLGGTVVIIVFVPCAPDAPRVPMVAASLVFPLNRPFILTTEPKQSPCLVISPF